MSESSWRARPYLAAVIETTSVLVPVVGASAITWWVGLELPMMGLVASLLVLSPVAVLTGLSLDLLARRTAPLSVLLRMAMVFPDRTPSRFAVAREAGHPRELTRRLLSEDLDESTAAGAVLSLVGALSAHDRRTRGHSERVRAYTDLLSERMGLAAADRDRLRWAGLLHDIGKLDVPTEILNKPGQPDADEWQTLQQHPDHGARLAAPLLPWLGEWGDAIAHHHERVDGTGYPRGLAGDEISIGGRIVAVVDSFETMTASRSYKKAMSHRAAREELARCAGTQFDAAVVREFLQISLPRLLWVMGPVAALVQLPFLSSLRYAGGRVATASGGAATAIATPAIAAGVATAFVTPALATTPAAHVTAHSHPVAAVQTAHVSHPATPVHESTPQPAAGQVAHPIAASRPQAASVHHHVRATSIVAPPAPPVLGQSPAGPAGEPSQATAASRHRTEPHHLSAPPSEPSPQRSAHHPHPHPHPHRRGVQPHHVAHHDHHPEGHPHHERWWHRSGRHVTFPLFGEHRRHHGGHHHHAKGMDGSATTG